MDQVLAMAKVPTLLLCQLAFDSFCSETSLPQLKQDLLELRQVFLPCGTENGDVICVCISMEEAKVMARSPARCVALLPDLWGLSERSSRQ